MSHTRTAALASTAFVLASLTYRVNGWPPLPLAVLGLEIIAVYHAAMALAQRANERATNANNQMRNLRERQVSQEPRLRGATPS